MRHKLYVIGYIGQKCCYLDVDDLDGAVERFMKTEPGMTEKEAFATARVIEFYDEFAAYDVWEIVDASTTT